MASGEHFRRDCAKCHGADGTGRRARRRMPEIPDFTDPAWQERRADAQLLASILDGKGNAMPPAGGDLTEAQAGALVAYLRTFGNPARPKREHLERPQLANRPKPSRPSASPEVKNELPPKRTDQLSHPLKSDDTSSAEPPRATAGPSSAAAIFRRDCAKCHGADGTGRRARRRMPEIPDFTDPAWQERRADAQLLASILDGKGNAMPPAGGDLTEAQAGALVAYLRAFATRGAVQGRELIERPASTRSVDDEPPAGLLQTFFRWIGKFHPPSVHFPIALITAAAVAEILRMTTGNPNFDSIGRFCLWSGSLTAAVAGLLGWFLGGFHLTDSSWVMMIHRWLGTVTVAGAAMVLALSEASRRTDRGRARRWSRVMLLLLAALVSATGFFGGAAVFGLDHYDWPR